MRPIVYPYRMNSRSARELARHLGCRRVWPDRNYRPYRSHLIINWGNSRWPDWNEDPITPSWLNKPYDVRVAANKLRAFRTLGEAGVAIPRFTRLADAAHEWDTDVMIRELLNSHSGRGMRFVPREDRSSLLGTTAPLYVEYIKKLMEYRVHVMGDKVIDVQQKRVREGSTGNDFQIRSYNNGWVFCRDGVDLPSDASPLAVDAVRALRLDFGAVDIIYNALRQKSYVLEVNTAPGLHGSTIEIYANAIQEML